MTNALMAPATNTMTPPTDDLESPPGHRLVLIDPRPDRRAIMSFLLEHCPGLTVVGQAANRAEAVAQIDAEHADAAVVEIQMPVEEGLATIGALRAQFPELRIVVCSFLHDPATQEAARAQGADAYLAKPPRAVDVLALIRQPRAEPTNVGSRQP